MVQRQGRKDLLGAVWVCRAIWGENHGNSVPTGLKMHRGSAQQRIRWGPRRMGRNAEARKLQSSQRIEGQAEKKCRLHQAAAGSVLCMNHINRWLWRTCESHGIFQ